MQVADVISPSVLDDPHPPKSVGAYKINWLHPPDLCANWTDTAVLEAQRIIDKVSKAGAQPSVLQTIPLAQLWVVPAMNGFPVEAVVFQVRALRAQISVQILFYTEALLLL